MLKFITILALGLTASALSAEVNPRFFTNGHAGFQFFHALPKKEEKFNPIEKNNSDYDEEAADTEKTEVKIKIPAYAEIKRNNTKINIFDRLKNLNKFKSEEDKFLDDDKENLAIEESNNRRFFNTSNEINLNFKKNSVKTSLVKIKILDEKPENRSYLNVLNELESTGKNLNKKRENGPNLNATNLIKDFKNKSEAKIFLVQKHNNTKIGDQNDLALNLDQENLTKTVIIENTTAKILVEIGDNFDSTAVVSRNQEDGDNTSTTTVLSNQNITESTTNYDKTTQDDETTIKPKYNRVYHYDPKRTRQKEQPKKPEIMKPRRNFKTNPRKTYQTTTKRPVVSFTRKPVKFSTPKSIKLMVTHKPRNFTKPSKVLYTRKPGDTFMLLHRRMLNVSESTTVGTTDVVVRNQRHVTKRPMFKKMHVIIYT